MFAGGVLRPSWIEAASPGAAWKNGSRKGADAFKGVPSPPFFAPFAASREAFPAPHFLWLTRRREETKGNRAGARVRE